MQKCFPRINLSTVHSWLTRHTYAKQSCRPYLSVVLLSGIHNNLFLILQLGVVLSSISMVGTCAILGQSSPPFSWQLSVSIGHSLMYNSFNDCGRPCPGKHGIRGQFKIVIAAKHDASSRPRGKVLRLQQWKISSFCRVAGSFTGKLWRLVQSVMTRFVNDISLISRRRGSIRLEHELMRRSSSVQGSKLCCCDGASFGQS